MDDGDAGPGGADDLGDFGDEQAAQDDDTLNDQAAQSAWEDGEFKDDPLQCRARDMLAAMPRRMRAMRAELKASAAASDALDGLDLNRVWTTLCVIALLESINVCWLATDGDDYPDTEHTIVDAAYAWLEAQAAVHPELKSVLGEGAAAARRVVPLWHRAWLHRIAAVRRSEAVLAHVGKSHAHRAGGELLRALVTRHDTFRVFLSEPLDGLQRWQMWCIVLTLLLTQLLTNIWMFYAKVRLSDTRVTALRPVLTHVFVCFTCRE